MKINNRGLGFRIAVGTAVVALTTALAVSASAAGFAKTQTYTDGMFADVAGTEWYAAEVKSTYELGLMNGQGNGIFAPGGNVTVAEAITMASRAAAINAGETIAPAAGGAWYQMYIDYAMTKGFVKDGQFDDYTRPAKRYEVAQLFENAMPDGYFTARNKVEEIPDVSEKFAYQKDLLTLYKAGVVMGSDSYGNFLPENNITRAEAAAIINRVALPQNRLSKTLDKYSKDDAYALVYNLGYAGMIDGVSSGWRLDNRGGMPKLAVSGGYGTLTDTDKTAGTAMIREFNKITTGVINVEANATVLGEFDGFSLEFRNEADELVYQIKTVDHNWAILGTDGKYTTIVPNAKDIHDFVFNISVDLDNNRSTTYINKVNCGTYPLLTKGDATNVLNFRFATDDEGTPTAKLNDYFRAMVNYAMYDTFSDHQSKEGLPFGWVGNNATNPDGNLKIDQNGVATKYFTPVSGTAIANAEFILSNNQSISFAVKSGAKTVVNFTSDKSNFYANGVMVYNNYVKNLWYRIRIEALTEEGKANIYVNSKLVGQVDFAEKATSIDNVSLANFSSKTVSFDDINVFEKKYHEDYVPAPVRPAGEEKYTVGINICSLWQNGQHWGWSAIAPFEEAEPVLGYYDEARPETADWEIKYMVEHGIDFQAFCWYPDNNNAPLKEPEYDEHLLDAYMFAEYSDEMKFCLIYEAANSGRPSNMFAWRNYYIPYIIEYYFKDPRYMTIDNKPIFAVFGASKLCESLGGEAATKQAFEYLEQEAIKLGFDGVIFLSSHQNSQSVADSGYDGFIAYNWGTEGSSSSMNMVRIKENANRFEGVYGVPTVSVGFNSIPWHGVRYPMMSADDFEATHTWVRDEYLPQYAEKGTWQENFVWISTWNEYGEGTYIMPSKGHGFGYLDALRKVYTDEDVDESLNIVPTDAQKERINHLTPQYRHGLKKQGYVQSGETIELEVTHTIDFSNPRGVSVGGTSTYSFSDTGIEGRVEGDTLVMVDGLKIPAEEAQYIKLRIDVPKNIVVQLYWKNNKRNAFNADFIYQIRTSEDGMNEYIIDTSTFKGWQNNITGFRVDPGQTGAGVIGNDFYIESVEFLAAPKSASTAIVINDQAFEMKFFGERSSTNEYLIAFDPSIALDFRLNCYYDWRADEKTLKLSFIDHEVVYKVGSSKYTVDGVTKDLGFELYAVDGLPMIPIAMLCKDVGFECTVSEDNVATIITPQKAYFDEIANRPELQWEFELPGDTEGWTSSNMSMIVTDGFLRLDPTGTSNDLIMGYTKEVNFPAAKYNKCEIRFRYKYESTYYHVPRIYFTSGSGGLSEARTIYFHIQKYETPNNEWETVTVDLTQNPEWKGNIRSLRFDPVDTAKSWMEIDYLRFYEDENYNPEVAAKFEIKNPDAEGNTNPFRSSNATVSIVKDPLNEDNKVYLAKAKPGKQWTYFTQSVVYGAGKTYDVEFDVMIAGLGDDISCEDDSFTASIFVNATYYDADGNTDHIITSKAVSVTDGWYHYKTSFTVPASAEVGDDGFNIYANPVGELAVNYYVDNIKVVEQKD